MRPGLAPAFPLLEGEAQSGTSDAAHWTDVYEQLVNFCHSVLAERDALDTVDRDGLRRRLRHFEQRRDYWQQEGRFAEGGRSA
jgi:hypothetical protein